MWRAVTSTKPGQKNALVWLLLSFALLGCRPELFTLQITLRASPPLPLVQRLQITTAGAEPLSADLLLTEPSLLPVSFSLSLPRGFQEGSRLTTLVLFDVEGRPLAHSQEEVFFQRDGSAALALTPSVEVNCHDGEDDDLDQATDCQDSDCAQGPDCGDLCGDGQLSGAEECDGAALGGQSCSTALAGSDHGSLSCDETCHLDTSGCYDCGDGVLDPGEDCEPPSEAGDCTVLCQIATCGDGFVAFLSQEHFEACDDGNLIAGDGCSPLCLMESDASELIADLTGHDLRGLTAAAPSPKKIYAIEALSQTQSRLVSISLAGVSEVHPDIANGLTPYVSFGGAIFVAGSRDIAGEAHNVVELIDPVSGAKATIIDQPGGAPNTSIDLIFSGNLFFGNSTGGLQRIVPGPSPQTSLVGPGLLQNQYLALFHGIAEGSTGLGAIGSQNQVALQDLSQNPPATLLLDTLPPGAEITGLAFAGLLEASPSAKCDACGFLVSFRLPSVQKSFVKQYVRVSDGSIVGRFLIESEMLPNQTGITALSFDEAGRRLLLVVNQQLRSLQLDSSVIFSDTDLDGAADLLETSRGTDPLLPDTDGDGLSDGFELTAFFDLGMLLSPNLADTDSDGVIDSQDLP
jgi:cysteine-rich repeat protein